MTERDEEILALHRQVAAERLRADQGWERAEAKSRECLALRDRMADQKPAIPEGEADQLIELAGALEIEWLRQTIAEMRAIRFHEGPYQAGWETCLEELEARRGFEITESKPLSEPAPPGFKLVPIEPTAEMLMAGAESQDKDFGLVIHNVYKAMLDAAKETSHVPT